MDRQPEEVETTQTAHPHLALCLFRLPFPHGRSSSHAALWHEAAVSLSGSPMWREARR